MVMRAVARAGRADVTSRVGPQPLPLLAAGRGPNERVCIFNTWTYIVCKRYVHTQTHVH